MRPKVNLTQYSIFIQHVSISWGNALAPNKQQDISWASNAPIQFDIYVFPCHDRTDAMKGDCNFV